MKKYILILFLFLCTLVLGHSEENSYNKFLQNIQNTDLYFEIEIVDIIIENGTVEIKYSITNPYEYTHEIELPRFFWILNKNGYSQFSEYNTLRYVKSGDYGIDGYYYYKPKKFKGYKKIPLAIGSEGYHYSKIEDLSELHKKSGDMLLTIKSKESMIFGLEFECHNINNSMFLYGFATDYNGTKTKHIVLEMDMIEKRIVGHKIH